MKFNIGDVVHKTGGDYIFIGTVVAAFTKRSGVERYVVENGEGILFIFNEKSLELLGYDGSFMRSLGGRETMEQDERIARAIWTGYVWSLGTKAEWPSFDQLTPAEKETLLRQAAQVLGEIKAMNREDVS